MLQRKALIVQLNSALMKLDFCNLAGNKINFDDLAITYLIVQTLRFGTSLVSRLSTLI